jgi:ribonuclease P protein component
LFREGKSISSFPIRALYLTSSVEFLLQTGFSVSSKNFKKAVDRNRIKRLMREAYRLQKQDLQDILKTKNQKLSVFLIYTGKEVPEYQFISKKMGMLIQSIIKNINESSDKDSETK